MIVSELYKVIEFPGKDHSYRTVVEFINLSFVVYLKVSFDHYEGI